MVNVGYQVHRHGGSARRFEYRKEQMSSGAENANLGTIDFTSRTADVEKYRTMLPSHCGYEDLRNDSNYSYEMNIQQ